MESGDDDHGMIKKIGRGIGHGVRVLGRESGIISKEDFLGHQDGKMDVDQAEHSNESSSEEEMKERRTDARCGSKRHLCSSPPWRANNHLLKNERDRLIPYFHLVTI